MRALPALVALLLTLAALGGAAAPAPAGSAVPRAEPTSAEPTPAEPIGRSTGDAATSGADATASTATATNLSNGTGNVSRILWLPPGGVAANGIDTVTIDVGAATAVGVNESAARMRTFALREHVQNASSNVERQQRILDGLNEAQKHVISLRARQQAAIAAYANGRIDARTLLVRLARIRMEANATAARVRMLSDLAANTEDFSVENRVQPLLYDLQTFGGPVREHVVAALRGEVPAARVFVAANQSGVVLSTIVGDTYVREAYRADLRNRDGSGIDPIVARNVTARSYPEIWAAKTSTNGDGAGGTFVYEVPYPGGHLTAFVDGGTERVFKEYQHIALDAFPTGPAVERTLDLTIRVNRSYPGGPMRVVVVDPETGEPVDAVVKVGREGETSVAVGQTGADGVLWTVSPRGRFVVTAVETGSTDISIVTVNSMDPATVREAYRNATANGTASGTG